MENNNTILPIEVLKRRFADVAKKLPAIAGNEIVNFSLDNFRRQGFLGNSFQPWRPRKNPTAWGTKPKRNGRAILIDTGKLRRGTRVVQADWNIVKVANNMPYAKANNEGLRIGEIQQVKEYTRKVGTVESIKPINGKIKRQSGTVTVKAHTRKINMNLPQRQFIGESPYLRRNINRAISLEISKALT